MFKGEVKIFGRKFLVTKRPRMLARTLEMERMNIRIYIAQELYTPSTSC